MKKFLCILMCAAILLTGTSVAFAESTKPVITENLPSYIYVDADKPEEKDGGKYYTVNLSLEAEGETPLTFKWYYWDMSKSCYTELEGFTESTLTNAQIPYEAVLDSPYIKCEVSDLNGEKAVAMTKIVPVKEAKISVPEKIEFTREDIVDGAYQCTVKAELKNTGKDVPVKYNWYCKKGNGDVICLNEFSDTLDISVKEELILDGLSFYCEVTLYSVATSVSKETKVCLAPFFKDAPEGKGGMIDEYGTMTATVYSTEELTYKWYVSEDNENWTVLKDNEEYSGTKTNKLTALTTDEDFFDLYFRCEASDGKNTAASEAAHFSKPDIIITQQPEDIPAILGSKAVFLTAAKGVEITYRWEMYSPITKTWTLTSVKNKELTIKVNSLSAYDYKFRCVISDGEKSVTTNEVQLIKSDIVKKGDVDFDGNVTAADARLALRASVNLENYNAGSDEFTAADWNSDGKIQADDARSILRRAVGLE